jgi:hypothetical protein
MKTKRANLSILRNFYKYSGQDFGVFGSNIGVSLDPLKFPYLVVLPKDISALAADLLTKQAATLTGGPVETAGRDKAFDALADALNADANIVEIVVGLDLEMLLATGFLPVSTNRASSPLDDTDIVSLVNNGTTQALLQLLPVRNAKSYQLQISTDGGKTWVEAGISTRAIRIVLPNLLPGSTYTVRGGPSAAAPARARGRQPVPSCQRERSDADLSGLNRVDGRRAISGFVAPARNFSVNPSA